MSAPNSAGSFSVQLSSYSCGRNRRGLDHKIKVPPTNPPVNSIPIKIDENKKTFISWQSVAINSNDLNNEDKENLGFSPPYVNPIIKNQGINSSITRFKSKWSY